MNNKGADQTVRMRRLICTFVVRIWHKTHFRMTWPNYYDKWLMPCSRSDHIVLWAEKNGEKIQKNAARPSYWSCNLWLVSGYSLKKYFLNLVQYDLPCKSWWRQMSHGMIKPTEWVCTQRRLRSAWASSQSDQSLHCPHEETLGP